MHLARVFAIGLTIAALSAPAWAGGVTAPEEWVGVWEITQTTEDCGGGNQTVNESVDTICADDVIFDPDPDGKGGQECEGSVDETSFDITCSSTFDIFDCRITITIDIAGSRDGDTYTAMGTITNTVEPIGKLCEASESCQDISIVATRIDPNPEECADVPIQPATWGGIKSHYRRARFSIHPQHLGETDAPRTVAFASPHFPRSSGPLSCGFRVSGVEPVGPVDRVGRSACTEATRAVNIANRR